MPTQPAISLGAPLNQTTPAMSTFWHTGDLNPENLAFSNSVGLG